MKQLSMVGILAALLAAGTLYAQAARTAGQAGGHTAPLPQPTTDQTPAAPTGEVVLGPVRLTRRVKANGEPLPAGTYVLRVTPEDAQPPVAGQTPPLERWVEFRQGKQVKAKEVATIIPSSEISKVQKDPPPKPGSYKVEMLKGNDYVRVWYNKGGNHYLVYLPPA